MSEANEIKTLGRKFLGDDSLGYNQAAHVLLSALASGEYKLVQVKQPKKEPEPKQGKE